MRTTPKRTYRRQMTFPFKREGGRLAHELAKASSTDDQGLPKGETKEERREPPSSEFSGGLLISIASLAQRPIAKLA